MARNYAALPHEYLEEMEALSDAEFGRLCRALLKYSMTGEEEQLQGAERLLLKRVFLQERRYQESYKEITESRREAGKKGASKRWHSMASDSKAMASDSKNGNTETKTEIKTNILPSDDGKNTRARDPAVAAVQADYLNRINPSASQNSLDELAGFVEVVGPDVCKRAFDVVLDNNIANPWRYIKAVLEDKQRNGVKCLADWDALEKKRKSEKQGGDASALGWPKSARKKGADGKGAWEYVGD